MRAVRISLFTHLQLNCVKEFWISTILDLPRIFQLPPIPLQALRKDWIIFTVRFWIHHQPMWFVLVVGG